MSPQYYFGGRLPAYLYCRSTTTIRSSNVATCVWGSKNSHKSGRSLIHCCCSASVEQPTSPSTWLWTYFPGVPLVLKTHLFCWGQRRIVTVCFVRLKNMHLHFITLHSSTRIWPRSAPELVWLPTSCCLCVGHLCMECKQIYNTGMREYMLDSYNLVDFTVLSLYLASYTLRFLVDRWIKAADAFYDGTSRARDSLVERNRTQYDLITTEVFSDEEQPLHSYFMKAC